MFFAMIVFLTQDILINGAWDEFPWDVWNGDPEILKDND